VTRVLLVEDDASILTTLAITLQAAGYEVDCAATATQTSSGSPLRTGPHWRRRAGVVSSARPK